MTATIFGRPRMVDRRTVLLYTVAAGAAAALPELPALARSGGAESHAALDRLFTAFLEEDLRRHPERATQLGFDKGKNADLKGRLSDESAAGIAADKS